MTDSNFFSITEQVLSAPQWFSDMPEKTWVEVAGGSGYGSAFQNGDRIIDQDPPTPNVFYHSVGVVVDWTGGVVDQSRGELLLAANGGHNGYAGNEVYAVKFRQDVPAVVRLTDRTPDEFIRTDQVTNVFSRIDYDDGLPRASHTYHMPAYDPGRSMIIWNLTQAYTAGNSGVGAGMWTFNRQSVDDYVNGGGSLPVPYAVVSANGGNGPDYWHYRGLAHDSGSWSGAGTYAEASPGFWDPINNKATGVWKWQADDALALERRIWEMDPAVSGTWTDANGGVSGLPGRVIGATNGLFGAPGWVVPDSTPPVYIQLSESNETTYQNAYILDLTNKAAGFIVTTMQGATAPKWTGYGGGYHAPSQAGLLGNPPPSTGSPDVWKVKLDDPANALTSTVTLSLIQPAAGNTVIPYASGVEGSLRVAYNKFNIIHDMGNGQGALIFVGLHDGPSFVYKLPVGELL